MARPVHASLSLLLVVVALFAAAEVAAQGSCSASSPCPATTDCCSQFDFCGTGDEYCGTGCKSGPCTGTPTPTPPSPPGGAGWSSFFTESDFNNWFPNRNSFYTFQAFSDATSAYPAFGTSGSADDQKREIAAFFGNVQQESGGLQFVNENNPQSDYCQADNTQYPCAAGKSYYGRGPIQLSWNYNYGACGDALGLNLLADPDQVAQNGDTAFKTALWFWMTSGCHDAILRNSFASTNRIINGIECGHGFDQRVENRVNAYVGFCQTLQVDPGTDLRC
jgi:chitinase